MSNGSPTPQPPLAEILERVSDAFVALDREWRYTYVNARAAQIFGRKARDLIGRHIWTEFPEGVGQPFHHAYERAMRDQAPIIVEEYYEPYDRWFENRIYPSAEGLTIYFTDITERKKAEQRLQQAEMRLRLAIDGLGPNMFVGLLTLDGTLVEANRPALNAAGLVPAEVLGKPFEDTYWWSYSESVQQQLREAINRAAHGIASRYDAVVRTGENQCIDIDFSLQPLLNNAGHVAFIVPSAIVITERKRAEAALRESEERLRLALDAAQMGTFDWEVSDNRITWSRRHEQLWGFAPGEFGGTYESFASRVHPDDLQGINDEVAHCVAARTPFAREFRIVWPDRSVHWAAARGEFTFDAAGRPLRMRGTVVEVTDRKQAEGALHEHRERLARIVETAAVGIFVIDTSGTIIFANAALERMAGMAPGTMTGLRYADLPVRLKGADGDLPDEERPFRRVLRTGEVVTGAEFPARRADGADVVLSVNAAPLRDSDGMITGVVATISDITDRKRAETSLRESEERLRLALDAAQMGIFDWEVPHNRITWSRRHEELWGFAPGEFGGTYESFASRVHPDDLPATNDEIARCIATRAPFAREFRVVWPDASVHWVVGRGEFTFDAVGHPLHMRGTVVEITERKLAEQALRDSEMRFRRLFEQASDAIFVISSDNQFLEANQTAERMMGYTRTEFLGMQVAQIVAPHEIPRLPEEPQLMMAGVPHFAEWVHRRKDGSVFPAEVSAARLNDESYIAIVRDLTERKNAEAQLRESAEALRALSKHLNTIREEEGTRIARELHDELGQSLTGIKIDLMWLDKHLAQIADGGRVHALRERITIAARQVDATIHAVRRISSDLRPGVLDDLGIVAAIQWQAQEFETRTGIRCVASVPTDSTSIDPARATALYRILLEALTNVVRHAEATRVDVTLALDAASVNLDVQDDGRGIPMQAATSSRSIGVLGMRERARAFGGDVTVFGTAPCGTRIHVEIPLT